MDENLDPDKIEQVNKQLGNLQDASSNLANEFDKTKDSTTGLQGQIDKTKTSTADLQKALSELKEQFGKFSEFAKNSLQATDDLTRGQKSQEKSTENLNDAINNAEKNIKDFIDNAVKDAKDATVSRTESEEEATDKTKDRAKVEEEAARVTREKTKAEEEAAKIQKEQQAQDDKLKKRIAESMGYQIDATGRLKAIIDSEAAIRKELQDQIDTQFGTETVLKTKQQELLNRELATLGMQIDAENKLVSTAIELNAEQKETLAQARKAAQERESTRRKEQIAEERKNQKFGEAFNQMGGSMGSFDGLVNAASGKLQDLAGNGGLATVGIQTLAIGLTGAKKVLDASIEAQLAYTKALLGGARGLEVEAQRNEKVGKSVNDVIRSLSQLSMAIGGVMIALGPLGWIGRIAGAAAVGLGLFGEYTAKARDAALELQTQLAGLYDKIANGFVQLGSVSLASSRGITGLSEDLNKLRLSFSEVDKFIGVVKNAGKEISMLGAGTTGGIKQFVETAGGLIKSGLGNTLEEMGIMQEQQMKSTMQYMLLQERLGRADTLRNKNASEAAGKYIVQLDKLAVLTGATVEEQEKARDQIMAIEELRARMMEAETPEEKARLEKALQAATTLMAAGAKEAAAGLARIVASGGSVTDEASAKLMVNAPKFVENILAGQGEVVDNLKLFGNEVEKFAKTLTGVGKYSFDAVKDIMITGFGFIQDYQIRMGKINAEATEMVKQGQAKTLDEAVNKILSRETEDPKTKEYFALVRAQQQKAIDDQVAAVKNFGTATGLFNQGVDAFGEYVKSLKGGTTSKGPTSPEVAAAEDKTNTLRAKEEAAIKDFQTAQDNVKAAEQELKDLIRKKASKEERLAQEDKIKKLKDIQIAEEEKFIKASRELSQAGLEEKNARQRARKQTNTSDLLQSDIDRRTKNAEALKDKLAKAELDLEDAKKDPKQKSNVVVMTDLQRKVRLAQNAVIDNENEIEKKKKELEDIKKKLGTAPAATPTPAGSNLTPQQIEKLAEERAKTKPSANKETTSEPVIPTKNNLVAVSIENIAPAIKLKSDIAQKETVIEQLAGSPNLGQALVSDLSRPNPAQSSAPASSTTTAPKPVALKSDSTTSGTIAPTTPAKQEPSFFEKTKSFIGKGIGDLLSFGGKSGSKENFEKLDDRLETRVVNAAKEFKDISGNSLQVNSAVRDSEDQQRLWDESVKAGRPGRGPTGMPIAKPGTSKHERGLAIDIQQGTNSTAVAALSRQGLVQPVANDPVHFELPQAQTGGIFDGPKSGYPVMLHGKELVINKPDIPAMVNALNKTKKSEIQDLVSTSKPTTTMPEPERDLASIIQVQERMIDTLTDKLDTMISKLSTSNDIQDRILTYQQT